MTKIKRTFCQAERCRGLCFGTFPVYVDLGFWVLVRLCRKHSEELR